MLKTIGDTKPAGFVDRIVAGCLIEYRLVDLDGWGFTLHDQDPFAMGIKDNDIGSLLQLVERQARFDLDQGLGKLLLLDQELDKMLSHPFFRSQHQVFLADLIKYEILTFL